MGRIPEGDEEEGGYASPSITHIWPHHRKMARMVTAGMQPSELAAVSGFSLGQISRILGSPLFQTEVARLESAADDIAVDIHLDLQKLSSAAIENLDEDIHMDITTPEERKIRQTASFDVLNRAGYAKKERPTFGALHLHKHDEVHIAKMSDKELLDDVMDLVAEEDDQ